MVPAAPGNGVIDISCVFVVEHPAMVSVTDRVPLVALLAKLIVIAAPVAEINVVLVPLYNQE